MKTSMADKGRGSLRTRNRQIRGGPNSNNKRIAKLRRGGSGEKKKRRFSKRRGKR